MEGMLLQAKSRVECELGFIIPELVAQNILEYAKRKLEVIRVNEEKDDDYIVLLYEDEIRNHYRRAVINAYSRVMK